MGIVMGIGLVVVVALLIIWTIGTYNDLIKLQVLSNNAWSDVDTQLKRRYDLVPNLVETVKGYARHERDTLEKVIQARERAITAPNPNERIEAENALTGALRRLFALAEAYPDLKASTNFAQLQNDLSQVETDIANARRYYNAVVRDYNTKQLMFPSRFVANLFHFSQQPFFEAEEQEREAVKVQF